MQLVKGNVYAELISPGCNVGIIATPKGSLIVDTPLVSRQAQSINEALRDSGHKPVRFIAITHPHGDHILGTGLFGEDALIIGNRPTYAKMGRHAPAWVRTWAQTWNWENPADIEEMVAAKVFQPQIVFEEELRLHLGGIEILILPLPGHMAESVGVFVPEAGVLITGDALFCGHHPYMGESDFSAWFKTFDKMRNLQPARIIPGHGPVCGNEAIDKQQHYMEKIVAIRNQWNPSAGEAALPCGALDELLAWYPLYGRPREMMRARLIDGIRVAGEPPFAG
ncbi:MAG: MBL fold metallo-hydrolase [Desulfobacterales bacterium]|nr:MAG: MBL fold metallo-hydrolase [Desulfobacterales bacterium]